MERWTAYRKTVIAFTGNVTLLPDRVTFVNGKSLAVALVRIVPELQAKQDLACVIDQITVSDRLSV